MFCLLKDLIILEEHCVFLVAVMPETIGACMTAMKAAGIANSGTKNLTRVITWQKPGKYTAGGSSQLCFDTEFYVMGEQISR